MQQEFINILLATVSCLAVIVGAGITWWVNTIWSMVRAQQLAISELHVALVKDYVPRAELQKTFERFFDKLDEIQREIKK